MDKLEEFIETFNVICPACKGEVKAEEDGSAIKCKQCRRAYPVKNGIPALVVEEAVVEDEESPETT